MTVLLASIGANTQAKRVAVSHFLFNVVGAIIFLFIFEPYVKFISHISSDLVRQIANAHTFFNVFCAFLFLPFTHKFAELVRKIV